MVINVLVGVAVITALAGVCFYAAIPLEKHLGLVEKIINNQGLKKTRETARLVNNVCLGTISVASFFGATLAAFSAAEQYNANHISR